MNEISARVKLFYLDGQGQWTDKGIGLASISTSTIEVASEETLESMLNSQLLKITPYRQSDTILCWSDEQNNHYALSFQQVNCADSFWNIFREFASIEKIIEPQVAPPIPANIEEIVNMLSEEINVKGIDKEWLNQLNKETISHKADNMLMGRYFFIYKELINLGRLEVLQGILISENFLAVFCALEHDEDLAFQQEFVKYFEGHIEFNNVLQIHDQTLIDLIHFAHRVLCLKEALMSKSFKESTLQALWTIHLSAWNQIITKFIGLPEVRANLILKVSEFCPEAFGFLDEVLSFSKFISNSARMLFYESLDRDGIIKQLQKSWFKDSNDTIRAKKITLEMFSCVSQILPKLLIDCFCNTEGKLYLQIFKEAIQGDLDSVQKAIETLKALLQPNLFASNQNFFKGIYDEVLSFYVDYLATLDRNLETSGEILNLLSHCLTVDTFAIRLLFISKNVVNMLNSLIKSAPSQLKISAIKVFKSIIIRKDAFLVSNMIKSESISTVLNIFTAQCNRENLLFSSILSLLSEIQKSELKILQTHVSGLIPYCNSEILTQFYNTASKPEQIDVKRSRSVSFDLSSQENFHDVDLNYNDFDLVCLGKRTSESFDEPVKKVKKNEDFL